MHRLDVKTIYNVEVRRKPFKTAKLQKWSKYNDFQRFDVKNFKTTQNYKNYQITWISSIWCPNDQNNAKQRKWSNYDEFASIWRQNEQNDELRRKTFKTTQNYESDQIIMNCIDLTSKRSKMLSYVAKQNNAKLQKWSKYNDFHRFDVKNFKTTQNCKSDQNCIDITSKWSKMLLCRKTFETTENYKSDQIGRHNEQNDELRRKTFKTTQNYKSDQNTMTCID